MAARPIVLDQSGHFTRDVALEHLSRAAIGRVAFVVDGQPDVLPVNIAVDDDGSVVFCTSRHSVLGTLDGATVALEVDGYDVASGSGWYVTVAGVAKEITLPADAASRRLHQLRVDPWAPRPRDRWMAVLPVGITGRRVARDGGSDAGWFAGVPAS